MIPHHKMPFHPGLLSDNVLAPSLSSLNDTAIKSCRVTRPLCGAACRPIIDSMSLKALIDAGAFVNIKDMDVRQILDG